MSKQRDEKDWNIIDLISSHRQELMGFAAFLVLFFHIWVPLFRSVPILREGEGFFKRIIYFSVDIFFFVSGFGLPRAIGKQSIILFYYRRIRRFIFPFLFIALLSFFGLSLQSLSCIFCFLFITVFSLLQITPDYSPWLCLSYGYCLQCLQAVSSEKIFTEWLTVFRSF